MSVPSRVALLHEYVELPGPRVPRLVPPREWARWVRGWTRGSGHRWERVGPTVWCPACGSFAVPNPRVREWAKTVDGGGLVKEPRPLRHPGSNPSRLRARTVAAVPACCSTDRVRQVQES